MLNSTCPGSGMSPVRVPLQPAIHIAFPGPDLYVGGEVATPKASAGILGHVCHLAERSRGSHWSGLLLTLTQGHAQQSLCPHSQICLLFLAHSLRPTFSIVPLSLSIFTGMSLPFQVSLDLFGRPEHRACSDWLFFGHVTLVPKPHLLLKLSQSL